METSLSIIINELNDDNWRYQYPGNDVSKIGMME